MRFRDGLRLAVVFALSVSAARVEAGFAGSDVFVPATARAAGIGSSQYYSTLWITNLGSAPASVRVQFLRQGQPNPAPTTRTEVIAAGATKRIDDVVTYLGESGGGALRLQADQEVFVSSRTYDQPPGTQLKDIKALFFSGIPAGFAIGTGETSRLQGVTNGALENFRYNFGLVETAGQAVTVRVTVQDQSGASLGVQQYSLGAWEARQVNAFTGFSPAISTTNALILVEVLSGAGRVIAYGTQVAGTADVAGSNDSAGFEMSFKDSLLSAGVSSLNGVTGAVTIASGANTTVSQAGSTITISSVGGGSGGLTAVAHDGSLVGSGTSSSKLGVAAPLNLTALGSDAILGTSAGGSYAGVSGSAEDKNGFGVHGHSGSNNTDGYLAGNGYGVYGVANDAIGVLGHAQTGTGVAGSSHSGDGVFGTSSTGYGIEAQSQTGVAISAGSNSNNGVEGYTSGINAAGAKGGNNHAGTAGYLGGPGYGVFSHGAFLGDGAKFFVEPHPTDPTKEIRYVCLEGPEAGTYFRGTGRIVGGSAVIPVPEDFRIVTSDTGLTVQVTPNGDLAVLACVSKDLNRIVVKGSADVEFDYLVHGVRKAFEGQQPIVENQMFVPRSKDDSFAKGLPAESVRRLKASGILNDDGTVNQETARRLGWDQRPGWNAKEPSAALR